MLLRLMKKGSILYNRFWFSVSSLHQLAVFVVWFGFFFPKSAQIIVNMQRKEYFLLWGHVEPLLKQSKPKIKQKNVPEIFLALGRYFKYACIPGLLQREIVFVVITVFKCFLYFGKILTVCQDMCLWNRTFLWISFLLWCLKIQGRWVLLENIRALSSTSPLISSILLLLIYIWGAE